MLRIVNKQEKNGQNKTSRILSHIAWFHDAIASGDENPDRDYELELKCLADVDEAFRQLRRSKVYRESDYQRYQTNVRGHFLRPITDYVDACARLGLKPDHPEATIVVDIESNGLRYDLVVRCTNGECVSREEALGFDPLPPLSEEIYAQAERLRAMRDDKRKLVEDGWVGIEGPSIRVCSTRG
jgi:hypothetical protein